MWPVTDRFLSAILATPSYITTATFTPPGGTATAVQVEGGSIRLDESSRVRRTGGLTIYGGADVYRLVNTLGGVLHIDHGLKFGRDSETVPVFHGELTETAQELGGGSIGLTLGDLMVRVGRSRFLTPFSPAAAMTRTDAIANIIQGAIPGATVINRSSDTGTVGSGVVWQDSRTDALTDLTKDGGTEVFQLPDGTFIIRDVRTLSGSPDWVVSRSLESASRKRPADKLYNTVVVRPSAADGSQTWTQQVAQITDVTHPRHPDNIGVVPYFWDSPTAQSAAAALAAAQSILSRVLGTTETLDLSMITNPALEGGDVLRVIAPGIGQEAAQAFKHYLDSFSLDLVTGSMGAGTRSAEDTEASNA